jgi:hypothetical protein
LQSKNDGTVLFISNGDMLVYQTHIGEWYENRHRGNDIWK